jgi:hypothetical protein
MMASTGVPGLSDSIEASAFDQILDLDDDADEREFSLVF